MQALPERIHDTEVMVDSLINQVLPRLEYFRQCVAENQPAMVSTASGDVQIEPADLRKGLQTKWIPAARERFDVANDAYYDIKHKASGPVVSLLQGQSGIRSIRQINNNLNDIRTRLDHLEDSLETESAVSRINDISPNFSGPVTRELEMLKARLDMLENRQLQAENSFSRQLKMQRVYNRNFDLRIKSIKERQAALKPRLSYLDGRTSERSKEMRQIQDEMTRFQASIKLVQESQESLEHKQIASSGIPFREAAAAAAVLCFVALSGAIVYQSFKGDSNAFPEKTAIASDSGERSQPASPDGIKYLPH